MLGVRACVLMHTPLQIGDWGRKGNSNQMRAADLMGQIGACMPPDFVVSTGACNNSWLRL